jgi:hypothetical protein
MRKLKGRAEGKQTLEMKIYHVISIGIKPPLVHIVQALTKEYCFPVTECLLGLFLTRHQGLATKSLAMSLFTSMPYPLRSFSMKEGGLHIPAQSRHRRSTPSRRVDDLPASHQDSKGWHTEIQLVVHSRIGTQGSNTLLSHSL